MPPHAARPGPDNGPRQSATTSPPAVRPHPQKAPPASLLTVRPTLRPTADLPHKPTARRPASATEAPARASRAFIPSTRSAARRFVPSSLRTCASPSLCLLRATRASHCAPPRAPPPAPTQVTAVPADRPTLRPGPAATHQPPHRCPASATNNPPPRPASRTPASLGRPASANPQFGAFGECLLGRPPSPRIMLRSALHCLGYRSPQQAATTS